MKQVVALVVCAVVTLASNHEAAAQKRSAPKPAAPTGPANYSSDNFLLHTDLSPLEAQELLARLELMLRLISNYWERPLKKTIECYVVKDLNLWPADSLLPEGRAKIARGEGVTISVTRSRGGVVVDADAVVFAVADRGTPQHEAVHAYCSLTFGTTGPTWYSEGMAEMGQYWQKDNRSEVKIHDGVLKYLQESEPEPLSKIVDLNQTTGDSWENYAWRWALCHLLANNPNYADRFRPLGLGLLTEQPVSFELTYGAMANEISFEYLFFLEHLDQGLRADLIAWDWSKKFLPLKTSQKTAASTIQAKRGWQPSGLTVEAGVEYKLKATGNWKTTNAGAVVTADGSTEDAGKLEGVIFADWKLGEPFPLGAEGVFKAPSAGDLYLRCRDEWTALADNSGKLSIRLNYLGAAKDAAAPVFKSTSQESDTAQAPAAAFRVWKSATGAFQIEAKLVYASDNEVELEKKDGSKVKVPLTKLSAADRKFVESASKDAPP